ncbi:MAG: haloacid dehalogenase-like hydrolase [Acidobacteria bacterium]|nr:haloacid dehalogenase-like hydrolase [Acidobacteriota bacterium]
MNRIVLFDIDGTLLTMGDAAKVAFADALTRAAGRPIDPDGYSFSGKTDPQIARDILALHGVTGRELEAAIPETIRLYVEAIGGDWKRLADARLLPGVNALLEALHARGDACVALLTGNVEGGARVKVGHFDLTRYFDFSISCFGSDDADRYRLPALALQRARRRFDEEMTGEHLVVVGDSEHDVLCARTVGARTVAVGTGWTTESRLRALRPDVFLDDLSDTGRAVAAILDPER